MTKKWDFKSICEICNKPFNNKGTYITDCNECINKGYSSFYSIYPDNKKTD